MCGPHQRPCQAQYASPLCRPEPQNVAIFAATGCAGSSGSLAKCIPYSLSHHGRAHTQQTIKIKNHGSITVATSSAHSACAWSTVHKHPVGNITRLSNNVHINPSESPCGHNSPPPPLQGLVGLFSFSSHGPSTDCPAMKQPKQQTCVAQKYEIVAVNLNCWES